MRFLPRFWRTLLKNRSRSLTQFHEWRFLSSLPRWIVTVKNGSRHARNEQRPEGRGGEASGRARRHDEANEANASCASQNEASPSVASQDEPNEAVNVDGNVDGNVTVNDIECMGQPSVAKRTRTKFKPPTVEEVADYCRERGNDIDPQRFFDYNEARGWMLGKSKMKDWRAAVRTWERGGTEQPGETNRIEFLEGT